MTPAVGAAFRTHRRAAIRALHQHGDPWAAEAASLEDADESPLIPLLPDVSGWDYQGLDTVDGESAHVWYLEDPELDKVRVERRHTRGIWRIPAYQVGQ